MLCYDRIDVSERIYTNKTSAFKKHNVSQYWYFLHKEFTFQMYVCNGCYDVLMIFFSLSHISILKIHGIDYRCIITGISISYVVNLLKKADLN